MAEMPPCTIDHASYFRRKAVEDWLFGLDLVSPLRWHSGDHPIPIEISFLKGMKSTPARKIFKTQAALEAWLAIHGENITISAC